MMFEDLMEVKETVEDHRSGVKIEKAMFDKAKVFERLEGLDPEEAAIYLSSAIGLLNSGALSGAKIEVNETTVVLTERSRL